MADYLPSRGDLVWLTFDPLAGHEAGRRPAVVLSPTSYNGKVGLAFICPITDQIKGYPFEVLLPPNVGVTGVILADQVKSLDWMVRRASLIAILPDEITQAVLQKIGLLLGASGQG